MITFKQLITEISAATAKSYINKAEKDKKKDRSTGINKAVDRIVNAEEKMWDIHKNEIIRRFGRPAFNKSSYGWASSEASVLSKVPTNKGTVYFETLWDPKTYSNIKHRILAN